jgi:prepilin-type N-terminal cleavage/methylation domain-containing protein
MKSTAQRAHRRTSGSTGTPRGYTAVEVLIAMTVMAIGAAAVMTMQKASMQGNLDARKMDVATAIAHTWEERLQRDAMAWTQPGPHSPSGNNMSNAAILAEGWAVAGNWFVPDKYMAQSAAAGTSNDSYGFDILGRDLSQANLGGAVFCVAVRLTQLLPQTAAAVPQLIRADVRVLWRRDQLADTPNSGASTTFCASGGDIVAPPPGPDPTLYRAVYVSTSLQENPQ